MGLPATMNAKNWQILFKSHIGEETRQPMSITQKSAMAISSALNEARVRTIDIHDDEGNLVETITKTEIRGVKQLGLVGEFEEKNWICNYGVRHCMGVECECRSTYGLWMHLLEFCKEEYNIRGVSDISDYMRKEFASRATDEMLDS